DRSALLHRPASSHRPASPPRRSTPPRPISASPQRRRSLSAGRDRVPPACVPRTPRSSLIPCPSALCAGPLCGPPPGRASPLRLLAWRTQLPAWRAADPRDELDRSAFFAPRSAIPFGREHSSRRRLLFVLSEQPRSEELPGLIRYLELLQ